MNINTVNLTLLVWSCENDSQPVKIFEELKPSTKAEMCYIQIKIMDMDILFKPLHSSKCTPLALEVIIFCSQLHNKQFWKFSLSVTMVTMSWTNAEVNFFLCKIFNNGPQSFPKMSGIFNLVGFITSVIKISSLLRKHLYS